MIGPWYLQVAALLFDLSLLVLVVWAVARWDERRIARELAAESERMSAQPVRFPRHLKMLEPEPLRIETPRMPVDSYDYERAWPA